QLGHRLEPVGDHAKPELAEMLRLYTESVRERSHDVARRNRAVAVHEVVQIPGREARARGQLSVCDARLGHPRLDRRTEGLLAETPPARHLSSPCPGRQRLTVALRRLRAFAHRPSRLRGF